MRAIKLNNLKYLYSAILFCLLIYISVIKVSAADKVYTVSIEQSYESVKFSFEFKEAEKSGILIKSPDNKLYEADLITDTLMECTVNKPKKGTWNVFVTSSESEIGSIETKVKGYAEAATDISKEVTVATDIVNLKMYMVDSVLHVTWGNTSDRINVKVVDAKTLQVMDNKTVEVGSYYTLDLKNSTAEEVLVYVVPSTSASVIGAGVQYTVSVINDLKAEVVYEDIYETNRTSIKATVKLDAPYKIRIVRDEITIIETDTLPAGEYNYDLETQVGYNKYTVYVINEKEYKNTFSKTVYMDVIAPELRMDDIKQSFTVTQEIYRISGFADGYETLTVNNQPVVDLYDDGSFAYEYRLKEGVNNIKVVATDTAGNESSASFSIQYVTEVEEEGIDSTIITAICMAILAVFAVNKLKKKKNPEKESSVEAVKSKIETTKKKAKEKSSTVTKSKVVEDKNSSSKNPIAKNTLIRIITSFVITIVVIIVFFQVILQVVHITSNSMQPLLTKGDIVVFNRLAYIDDEIERGDIVCFWSKENGAYYVKRVIGLPGDEISFVDGYVMINGVVYEEGYVMEDAETNSTNTYIVAENSYFVLGDNRENSKDSRHFSIPFIAKEDIKGKILGNTGINIYGY